MVLAGSAALWVSGCSRQATVTYPTWAVVKEPYAPQIGSANGFDRYCFAAAEAEKSLNEGEISQVNFTRQTKKNTLAKLGSALSQLDSGVGSMSKFEFRPTPPMTMPTYSAGWRILGEAMIWRVEAAVESGNLVGAASAFSKACRFGFDLAQGDAANAVLGFHIVDEARKALVPALPKMDAATLRTVAAGARAGLLSMPSLESCLRNESENGLLAIQYWQDRYQKGELKKLNEDFKKGVSDLVKHLENTKPNSQGRERFFRLLDEARKTELKNELERSASPACTRMDYPKMTSADGGKLVLTWSQFFLRSGRTVITLADNTLARTRLLVIYAELGAEARTGAPPKDIASLAREISTDPYTGKRFVYRTNGQEFECYSVGQDGRDDSGQSDATNSYPDVRLER